MMEKQKNHEVMQQLLERIEKKIGENLTAETMSQLNGNELTLLAYHIFCREILEGGMVQLIYNGYGPFIFENPFAKAMRLWGLKDFSKFIYAARQLYEKSSEDFKKDRNDEEFMALYEQYPEMENMDDEFIEQEPQITAMISDYVCAHQDLFKD
ncbi:MAG: DMP19 family protein [Bacteroidaceae bacterium]|jgi:hypothetical protein|nr:DMP19 family protein [Bacteroidaceae bacterium]